MSDFDIAGRRLRNQLLVGPPAASPEAVIRHFVAVQAQEHPHAKWGWLSAHEARRMRISMR